jgi:hypothetical protein
MGEGAPKSERTPDADIRAGIRTILEPKAGEEGDVSKRDFGPFTVRRTTIMVGPRRQSPSTTLELSEASDPNGESHRYAYQTLGQERHIFIDGKPVVPTEGELLFQAAIKRALEAYEAEDHEA